VSDSLLTAKDPILFAGGDVDLYGYCLGNPITYIDPTGEFVLVGSAAVYGTYVLATAAVATTVAVFHYAAPVFADIGRWLGGILFSESGDEGGEDIYVPDDKPCTKANEATPGTPDPDDPEFLKQLKRVKSKAGRRRWVDSKGRIYEWDSRHGELEVYNKRGRHIGVRDPKTGKWTKPRVPGRRIEP